MHRLSRFRFLLALALAGCGGAGDADTPPLVEVTGTVTRSGEPLPGGELNFIPTGETPGMGGTAEVDERGEFSVDYARGGAGLPTGTYKVRVSRRLMPDGSPVPAYDETPPIESPATESIPAPYSNAELTPLTITVTESGGPYTVAVPE